MQKLLTLLFFICLSANLQAQNLVRPTGFEISVNPWYNRGISTNAPILTGQRLHIGIGELGEPMFGINLENLSGTKPDHAYSKRTFEAEGGGVFRLQKNNHTLLRLTGFLGFNSYYFTIPNPEAYRGYPYPKSFSFNESNVHGGLRADLSHYIFLIKPTEDKPTNFYIAPTIGAVCQFQPAFNKLYDGLLGGLNFSTVISYQPKRTNFAVIPSYGVGLYNQGFSLTVGIGHQVSGKAL